MHILDAALVHALAEAAQTRAQKCAHRRREAGIPPTEEPTPIDPVKAQAPVEWQKGWRRWFERCRLRVTA